MVIVLREVRDRNQRIARKRGIQRALARKEVPKVEKVFTVRVVSVVKHVLVAFGIPIDFPIRHIPNFPDFGLRLARALARVGIVRLDDTAIGRRVAGRQSDLRRDLLTIHELFGNLCTRHVVPAGNPATR